MAQYRPRPVRGRLREGFAGLSRAFMYAGADAPDALAEAQRALRAASVSSPGRPISRAHPFFWAPFVFVGD